MSQSKTTFKARILRKQLDLPRYVVVKPEYVGGRTHAFLAEGVTVTLY